MGHELAAIGTPSPPPTSLAPGFRFHPTDEELVQYYLKRKVGGKPFRFDAVSEIDVYKSEPWDLQGHSRIKTRDLEWYFFSPVDKKYGNGSRLNRATGKGYWKATGKDRHVRHKGKTIGMKKTLVFHGGRAPDGQRTNWVMHEYRLADEDLERPGMQKLDMGKDTFVLCRIFQKSGLGPPNADRYAPFIEEEWDNNALLVIPGEEGADGMTNGDDVQVERSELEQDTHSIVNPLLRLAELSEDPQHVSLVCKRERSEYRPSADQEPNLLVQNKRPKQVDPNSKQTNGSEDSTTTPTPQDLCLSTVTAATAAAESPTAFVEFPLLDSLESSRANPLNSLATFDAANLEKSVPPGFLKFISNLENEVLSVSMERETLKIEMMRAQAMISILQSRIEFLAKENEDLRRVGRSA